ncbi:Lysophospholipase L1 [Lihuaxuella thermophila]|uniref:Lysophospholipase L1 n=2 Tax=Lihuaxuella thermophila TaxID=1173111 RepID=A0A1H8AP30_9BACL|nr:Lysophospholipase L1 [Lihuaxuella thermophila]
MESLSTPVSYLALGDSLTEGIGAVSPQQHFVAQFFRHLQHSKQCHMRNWGISGMTSAELLSLVTTPGVTRLLPRLTHLSITTGGCDFIEMYEKGPMRLRTILQTIRMVQDRVARILEVIRTHNGQSTVYLLGFYIPLPAYELGVKKASLFVQTMNHAYAQLCRKYHVHFINPFDTFYNRFDYFADEVHPNQQGYDQLARLFIESGWGSVAGQNPQTEVNM